MVIPTYHPRFTVTLFKNVDRQKGTAARYQKAQRTIDLTPYLGEKTTITTMKDLQNPQGQFRLSFGDRADPTTMDTLYSLIEPMDVIEIRGSPTAYKYAGGKLPLLMRGFVGTPRRPESMGARPNRSVVVAGQDWGKLWLIHGVWMEVALSQEAPLLTTFQLQAALGMSAEPMNVGDFMATMTAKILNPKIQAMAAFAQNPTALPMFTCQSSVTQGQVVPQAVGAFSPGPFWNLVANFADRPWNELWVDDSDATGPVLIFRPTPYKDINGNFLNGSSDPGTILLDQSDILDIDVGRTDANVANFYWTPPGQSLIDTPGLITAWDIVQGNPADFDYQGNSPSLYGYRKMEWPTQLLPSLPTYPLDASASQQDSCGSDIASWHIARLRALRDMNRDNAALEDGVIRARGREDYKPGRYLQVTRGRLVSTFYLTRVTHQISPYGRWESTLFVERGDGFLKRNQYAGSPYYAEGRSGVYETPQASTSAPPATSSSLDASGGSLA